MSSLVWAEIVTVGSELVLGQLVDTNAAYIAQALAEIGVGMAYHTTVGDERDRQAEVFRQALNRCQIVVTTGGIGPTEDDLTREVAAEVLGRPLIFRPDLLEYIEGLFQRLGYTMPENNRRQAYIPEGAAVIHNPRGTAPAFRYEYDDRILICLPGVPHETEHLIRTEVLPLLARKYALTGKIILNRVLKICGLGESSVDAQIKDLIRSSKNPVLGLQAGSSEIKVRLTARADNRAEAERILDEGEARVREQLDSLIFGRDDETLAGNTAALLQEYNQTLAVAEALTNGLVTAEIGGRLGLGRLRGALVLGRPIQADELCDRVLNEFHPDLALVVTGWPDDSGRFQISILVRAADGRDRERSLSLGGPSRIIQQRAATMALFSLLQFLREETW